MDIINPYIHGGESVAFDGFGNRSRSFDGVDDYISIADNANFPTGAQTICCWVKFNTLNSGPSGQDLITHWTTTDSNNASFAIYMPNSNGKVRFYVSEGGQLHVNVEALDAVSALEWSHVACVFTPNDSIKIYINGSLSNTLATTGISSLYDSSVDLVLGGRDQVSVTTLLNGNLADFRFYDTDLTATDISDIYNGTNITTNLVGHGLIDADNVLDAVGTSHGTNYGTKYSYDNPSPPVEFGSASRIFNGVSDRIEIADTNDHSFGDGVNDSPFSVSAWIKIEATSKQFRILSKWSNDIGAEWAFSTDAQDRLGLFLKDASTNALIKRYYSTSLSIYLNQWVYVSATYDGRGGSNAGDGIDLYLNGVNVDDSNGNSGSYIAMENKISPTFIGNIRLAPNSFQGAKGKIADVRLYDAELTSSDIASLYNGTDIQTNLVGHWLTDNDDVEDKAGSNDGTNYGSTYSYDNPPMDLIPSRQRSRGFNGNNNYTDLGNDTSLDLTSTLTISFWTRPDNVRNCAFLSKWTTGSQTNNSFGVFLGQDQGNDKVRFALQPTSASRIQLDGSTSISTTEWSHVVCVADGSTMSIYVNGVLDTSTSYDGTIKTTTKKLFIGKLREEDNLYLFDGNMADVRLYDTGLSSTEVLDIYNGTTDRTNLIGQWLTNSDDVLDHAGTNDGTDSGSTYSTDSPS